MLPILIDLGWFKLYSYPLFMGISWGVAYVWSKKMANERGQSSKEFNLFVAGIFLAVWIGAKTLFLTTVNKNLALKYIVSSNFWLGGGFVFYGGLIGGLLFLFIYKHTKKDFRYEEYDYLVAPLCISHAIGRVGCFLAGCCYGDVCHLPWAVTLRGTQRHPVQLYESFLLLVLGLLIYKMQRKGTGFYKIAAAYIGGYSVLRFSLEFFRGDLKRGIHFGFISTSQIIAILLALVTMITYLVISRKKK